MSQQQIAVLVFIFIIIFLISIIIKFCWMNEETIVEEIRINHDYNDSNFIDIETNTFQVNEISQNINYLFTTSNQQEIECPICFEPINNCQVTQFTCLHKYHQKCLDEWNKKKTNEIDRKSVV